MTVDRDRVQPAVHRQPGRHRPAGPDLHDRHAARPARRSVPDAELFFITGADALAQILSWKDADELFELAHFVGVTRPGHELTDAGPARPTGSACMEVPAMAISLDRLPRARRAGQPVWYLVPDGVVQYIAKYRLYRASTAAGGAPATDFTALGGPRGRHAARHRPRQGGRLGRRRTSSPPRSSPSTSASSCALTDIFLLVSAPQRPPGQRHRRQHRGQAARAGRQAGSP